MKILSEILLAGYDIQFESASWATMVGLPEDDALHYFKLALRKHNGEGEIIFGAISKKTMESEFASHMISNTLTEMFEVAKKQESKDTPKMQESS